MTPDEQSATSIIAALEARVQLLDSHFEGARLRWRRIGEGPPLVLIHGGQGSWLHWVRNVDALAPSFTLWLPDLPGLGDSDEIPPPHSAQRLAAALRHGIDTLIGPEVEIALAAFSFGAALAVPLAVDRGGVSRLAIIGGTGHGLPRRTVDQLKWRDLPQPAQDEAHRYNLSQQMLSAPAAVDALALVVHRDAMQRTRLRSRPISRSSAMREALESVTVPVLMIWGEHDPTGLGDETARTLAAGRPEREWVRIPGASHWVQYERADAVNALLARWFAGSSVAPALSA